MIRRILLTGAAAAILLPTALAAQADADSLLARAAASRVKGAP